MDEGPAGVAPRDRTHPAIERLDRFLLGRHVQPLPGAIVCFTLVALVGWLDFVTGPRMSLVVLYLVPITLAAWWTSPRFAYALAVLAGLESLVDALFTDRWPPDPVDAWNAAVHIGFYVAVVWLILSVRGFLLAQDRLATTDGLTGVLNRRAFVERTTEELHRASRASSALTLLYLDLDGLKRVNDTQGHDAGDALLLRFTDVVLAVVRDSDVVARLGGDEFAVLLPDSDTARAHAVADRLIASLTDEGGEPPLRASIGLLEIGDELAGQPVESLLVRADELMYRAKREGGHQVASTFDAA